MCARLDQMRAATTAAEKRRMAEQIAAEFLGEILEWARQMGLV